MKVCPHCKATFQHQDYIFCPYCGTSLESSGTRLMLAPQDKPPPPPRNALVIEFRHSASSLFELALEEARKFPTFTQYGEGKKAIYRVILHRREEVPAVIDLVHHISGWKSAAVYLEGKRLPLKQVFAFVKCYKERETSFSPEFYCFGYDNNYTRLNLWGCVQADLPFTPHSPLWTFGRWLNKKGDWQFDKEQILHELRRRLYPYRLCPVLDWARVQAIVAALPDKVNPYKNKDWQFVRFWNELAPGLRVKIKHDFWEEEFVAIGVAPAHPRVLKQISKRLRITVPLPKKFS